MAKLLKIEEPEKIRDAADAYFATNEDARFVRRLGVILLVCDGQPIGRAAELFKVTPTTVQRWIHRVNVAGLEGLRDRPGRGRRSRLRAEDRHRLRQDLAKTPRYFGYDQARWDGELLSRHLKNNYQVDLKVRQCQNIVRQLQHLARPSTRSSALPGSNRPAQAPAAMMAGPKSGGTGRTDSRRNGRS